MSLSDKQSQVIQLWREWREHVRDRNVGWFPRYDTGKQIYLFYEHLRHVRPDLLDLPREEPYLVIRAWIEQDLDI